MTSYSKFACISLENCTISKDLLFPFELKSGFKVFSRFPFPLEDHWREWLGTNQVEAVENSNISFFLYKPTQNPGVLDSENESLIDQLNYFYLALILLGIPHYREANLLTGAITGSLIQGRADFRGFNFLDHYCLLAVDKYKEIDRKQIEQAVKVGANIHIILSAKKSVRLAKGLHAWMIASKEDKYLDFRLHQYVRSIEALLKLPVGKSKSIFCHRGAILAGKDAKTKKILGEIYDLRSKAEHLNDFEEALTDHSKNNREKIARLRTYQAEILCTELYNKAFLEPNLLAQFEDANLDSFWKRPNHELDQIFFGGGGWLNCPQFALTD